MLISFKIMAIVNSAKFSADFQPGFRTCVTFYNTDPDLIGKRIKSKLLFIENNKSGDQLTTLLMIELKT